MSNAIDRSLQGERAPVPVAGVMILVLNLCSAYRRAVVESTFQLGRGFGPVRERKLWRAGVARWDDLAAAHGDARAIEAGLSPAAADRLRHAVDEAADAFAARDADRLASLLPSREHWRLFEAFGDDAAYVDIETSDDVVGWAGISAIGIVASRS